MRRAVRRGRWAVLLGLGALLIGQPVAATAQARGCDDELRTLRVLANQLSGARSRVEIESAQVIADLLKQVDALKTDVDRLRREAAPAPAPKPAEPPGEPAK